MKIKALMLLALMVVVSPAAADVQTYIFTPAEMTACNTSPITLLEATPGTAYLPVRVLARRAGAAYSTQPGEIQIRYIGVAPVNPIHMRVDIQTCPNPPTCGGLLTFRRTWLAFAPSTGRYGADDAVSVDIGGKGVQLFCAVGNPTIDVANPGSDVQIELHYEVWPTVLP